MKTLSRSFLNQGTKCSHSRTANEVKKHGDYSEVSCSRDGVEYLLNHKGDPLLGFPSEVSGDRAIVLSGFPIDTSKFSDGGARYAPLTLRKYLNELSEDNQRPIRNKINDIFLHSGGFVDFGDIPFQAPRHVLDSFAQQHSLNESYSPITLEIIYHCFKILSDKKVAKLLSIGGDHYVSYPILLAHRLYYQSPISIIHFDAHTDTIEDTNPYSLNHATMFYHALNNGTINAKNSVQIGVRERNETEYLYSISRDLIRSIGVAEVVSRINSHLALDSHSPVYLTFDIDCLDPKIAPGTGTPMKHGLELAEVLQIISGLRCNSLIGADIVEYSPRHDRGDRTLKIVVQLLLAILQLLARAPNNENDN